MARPDRIPAFITAAALVCAAGDVRAEDTRETSAAVPSFSDVERNHWSFRPVQASPPPTSRSDDWTRTPIDRFIFAELEERGLQPAGRADRRTLIRRVTLDLTGLPPTPEEIDAFLGEPDFDLAWERLIDRLLASPHYGERWGQHWLDVVRYAESEGFEYDAHLPNIWMFRDYVIRSLNDDKRYDQFVREQLAGDEMVDARHVVSAADDPLAHPDQERLIAAGFHRLGPVRRNAGNAKVAFSRNEVLTERTDIVGTAFLGITIGCARCHDHMFDPLRQTDYYRLQAFLAGTYAHDFAISDQATYDAWKAETDAVNEEIERLRDAVSQATLEEQPKLRAELEAAQQRLPAPLPTLCSVRLEPEQRTDIHRLERGDPNKPEELLGMRVPGVLLPDNTPELAPDLDRPKSRLADWIVDDENPLTARVMANRIWQYHFGVGLVETANDFGLNGASPIHPELLDWLAGELVRHDWSIKALHREILRSACYLQASDVPMNATTEGVDPENRLLWRFPRRRLSAGEIRDAMLAVSGRLNDKAGGPGVITPVDDDLVALLYKPDQWEVTPDVAEHDRRSVYLIAKRNLRLPFLEVFDEPDRQSSCALRQQSTHALQALELLNGDLANRLAASFAERLTAECGDDHERIIDRAIMLSTGQMPNDEQRLAAREFLNEQPLSEFALAMFNLNAFLYVD